MEGSGTPPSDGKKTNLAAADIEWEASGIGPDDEDGDVVEGSGSPDGTFQFLRLANGFRFHSVFSWYGVLWLRNGHEE